MKETTFRLQAASMQKKVALMILQKQKATLAIAISLANDKSLMDMIEHNNIPRNSYEKLILKLRDKTLYKNVWIHIVDKNGVSLYRSWSKLKGDSLLKIREDLRYVLTHKKITYSVSVGLFDLSIKSMIPIFKGKKFIGVMEVITHFNSIASNLKESNIESVIIVDKEYNEQLKYPFTKLFIDDYYVANISAPKELQDYLKVHNVKNYFNNSYKVENGYLIVSYELKNEFSKKASYFIMFKKISDLQSIDLEFFTFKWITVFVLISLTLLFSISIILLVKNRIQKKYYKNILDTASNIVIVTDSEEMIDSNKAFFRYFHNYQSVDEFLKEYKCICDLFVKENGYLQPEVEGLNWIHYILKNPNITHKAKINYLGRSYYFSVTAALISKNTDHYSVVLTDITKEEEYQKELLDLSIKDSLTGVYNRHYFDQKIAEEISRVTRYKYPLSLIMLDVDFFKRVNDEHGHSVGDIVLVEYAKFISAKLRKTDTFCRTGGEEFMIILPYTAIKEAENIAQKLCNEIENYKKILPITMSFGVTQYNKDDTVKSLLKRVDEALYKAKAAGRNRVVTS